MSLFLAIKCYAAKLSNLHGLKTPLYYVSGLSISVICGGYLIFKLSSEYTAGQLNFFFR